MGSSHTEWMQIALDEARSAQQHGDVPVGAVVVKDGRMVAARHNERELTNDPTAHAEVLALRDAAEVLGSWRLEGCSLYVTLEPCVMCGGALVNSRIHKVIYGAADEKAGACLSLYNVADDPRLNHQLELVPGILADECSQILLDFFQSVRADRSAT